MHPRATTLATILVFGAGTGCGGPTVEIQTRVGAPESDTPTRERLEALGAVLSATMLETSENPDRPPPAASDFVAMPPSTPRELALLVRSTEKDPIADLGTPARNLAAARPSVWPHLRLLLLAQRPSPKGDYRSLLAAIGGDVPNRYGHFALHWKKSHGFPVTVSEDWFEDLLAVPASRIGPALRPVYRDCVRTTAMLRAAARIGRERPELTAEVVETLLDAAYLHQGTFRDEVGRSIAAIGDEAIPHLVRASIAPEGAAEDSEEFHRADYAEHNLDRMDRLHPRRAMEAVRSQPRRVVDLLDAYALARPGEAAEEILALVDATDARVRDHARASFMSYVVGPPPTAARKTLRLLGGGTTTKSAHKTYRQMASLAIEDRLAEEAKDLLEPPCAPLREDKSVDIECQDRPRRLAEAYFAQLDHKRDAARDALIARALAAQDREAAAEMLDGLLASGTRIERPAVLSPFFEQAAEDALERGDPRRSAQLLRKSAMLAQTEDPQAARRTRVRALVREASVPDLDLAGREMLLGTAIGLQPDSPEVRDALAGAHARAATGTSATGWDPKNDPRLWFLGIAGVLGLAALVGRPIGRRLYGPRD